MDIINELSTAFLTVEFLDPNGIAVRPRTIAYRIDDVTTGQVIRPLTEIDLPHPVIELLISAEENSLPPDEEIAIRRVTVLSTFGDRMSDDTGEHHYNDEFVYTLRNLGGLS